jgi:hypothetical protein
MAKYIMQLRRGWKYDSDPETGEPRDDWAKYTSEKGEEAIPKLGELVLEYDNGIPRLKIGDGVHTFAELEYMSVDSFILPKPISVTLYADKWVQATDDRYYQIVEVMNATITTNSKVDLQPSSEQLCIFHEKDLAFVVENEDGVVSVFCVGQVPTNDYTIQATVTEIVTN